MTDAESIKAHLLSGQSLTSADALRLFGVSRLAARIWDLQKAGLDIETETVEVPKRGGRMARVTRYRLKRTAGELFE